jgi:hypothetical protein
MAPEDDVWGGDDVGTDAAPPPVQGAPVPTFEAPQVPRVAAADLIRGAIKIRRGRLDGHFDVAVLPGGAVAVTVTGSTFAGKAHYGTVYFDQRGTVERRGGNYLRAGNADPPTDAAFRALVEGAAEALRLWVDAHPLAFEAADCIAAQATAARATKKVANLREDLKQAEADERTALLEHRERVALLAEKGVG